MATYHIVEGTTVPFRFQLLEAGSPIDLTDCTVEILVADRTGETVSSPGTVTVIDEAEGQVQLDPTSAAIFDAGLSPYLVRWKVTDGNSDIFYVPTGNRDIWQIVGA